jgi:hypothetical protein
MNAMAFMPPYAFCKDPKAKAQFCARLSTREGFIAANANRSVEKACELCGKQVDGIVAKLCPATLEDARGTRPSEEALRFLGERCPAETAVLGKQECAGRSYTGANGPDEAYRGFCTRYAREMLGAGRAKPASADPKTSAEDDALETGKKKLKGLFGF